MHGCAALPLNPHIFVYLIGVCVSLTCGWRSEVQARVPVNRMAFSRFQPLRKEPIADNLVSALSRQYSSSHVVCAYGVL